jgi:hypothetical protein
VTAFHPITITILRHGLAVQRRELASFQRRLEQVSVDPSPLEVVERYRNRVAELTAVVADFTELLRLIDQHDGDAADTDRQIAESHRADAERCELHLDLSDDALAALACGSVYPAATR